MKNIRCYALIIFYIVQLFVCQSIINAKGKKISKINSLTKDKSVKTEYESFSTTPWSIRLVESEMLRRTPYTDSWGYVEGTFLKSVEELWRTTNDSKYFQYIKNSLDAGFYLDGGLKSFNYLDYSLDEICEGRILLLMYKEGLNETKYQNAMDTLRSMLKHQPRTYDGGFWHRNNISSGAYPHQMWLDGVYMANPFYSEYGLLFNEPEDFNDVITQITVMERHARDPQTGLLYHGWDELHTQSWADPVTGCSPSFWGRAEGWYAMAVVDILDYLPQNYSGRDSAIAIIKRLAEALKKVQDPTSGVWWQVLDQGDREGNYRESSCSCMFVYALAKSIREGYIDNSYWDVVKKGYAGILNKFISINSDSTINLNQICLAAGLGFGRDGTFDYYANQTDIVSNDGKATGPFVLASLEVENAGLVIPPLGFSATLSSKDNVILTWKDMTYNAVSFIIERKKDGEDNFTQIAELSKGTELFTDTTITTSGKYYYRAKAVSDSSFSDYTEIDSVTISSTPVEEIDFVFYHLDVIDTAKVSAITDNIEASPLTVHGSLVIWDFSSGTCPGTSNKMRINKGLTGWAVDGPEQGPQKENFIQVVVAPKANFDFHVDSVNAWLACYGTHFNMHCAAYWDTDTNFFSFNNEILYDSLTSDELGEDPGLPDIRDDCTLIQDTSFAIGTIIPNGGYFALRFFPWFNNESSSTTKWFVIWDLRVYGTATKVNIPVELTSFSAIVNKDAVQLKWITATEVNNNGFEIERSSDKTTWKRLAFVKGNGTTTNLSSYFYKDVPNVIGKLYYRLKQVDFNGTFKYSKVVEVSCGVPSKFSLAQNYPNPFNPITRIKYQIPGRSFVTLEVFDVLGREVSILVNEEQPAGIYEVEFSPEAIFSSGIYFYQLKAGNYSKTKKMVLLR